MSQCPRRDIQWTREKEKYKKRAERNIEDKVKKGEKGWKGDCCLVTVVEEKWLQQRERWSVGYELKGRARTEIEIEEEINKGNPFSPDIGFHTDVVMLSGSIHLRHNAAVSTPHLH